MTQQSQIEPISKEYVLRRIDEWNYKFFQAFHTKEFHEKETQAILEAIDGNRDCPANEMFSIYLHKSYEEAMKVYETMFRQSYTNLEGLVEDTPVTFNGITMTYSDIGNMCEPVTGKNPFAPFVKQFRKFVDFVNSLRKKSWAVAPDELKDNDITIEFLEHFPNAESFFRFYRTLNSVVLYALDLTEVLCRGTPALKEVKTTRNFAEKGFKALLPFFQESCTAFYEYLERLGR